MTPFLILLIGSFGGVAALYLRHRADLRKISITVGETNNSYPALFVYFMESVVEGVIALWRTYVWGHVLRFTEKRLRWVRIMILKIERLLFRATHHVRNAAQQNENDTAQNENGNSDNGKQ